MKTFKIYRVVLVVFLFCLIFLLCACAVKPSIVGVWRLTNGKFSHDFITLETCAIEFKDNGEFILFRGDYYTDDYYRGSYTYDNKQIDLVSGGVFHFTNNYTLNDNQLSLVTSAGTGVFTKINTNASPKSFDESVVTRQYTKQNYDILGTNLVSQDRTTRVYQIKIAKTYPYMDTVIVREDQYLYSPIGEFWYLNKSEEKDVHEEWYVNGLWTHDNVGFVTTLYISSFNTNEAVIDYNSPGPGGYNYSGPVSVFRADNGVCSITLTRDYGSIWAVLFIDKEDGINSDYWYNFTYCGDDNSYNSQSNTSSQGYESEDGIDNSIANNISPRVEPVTQFGETEEELLPGFSLTEKQMDSKFQAVLQLAKSWTEETVPQSFADFPLLPTFDLSNFSDISLYKKNGGYYTADVPGLFDIPYQKGQIKFNDNSYIVDFPRQSKTRFESSNNIFYNNSRNFEIYFATTYEAEDNTYDDSSGGWKSDWPYYQIVFSEYYSFNEDGNYLWGNKYITLVGESGNISYISAFYRCSEPHEKYINISSNEVNISIGYDSNGKLMYFNKHNIMQGTASDTINVIPKCDLYYDDEGILRADFGPYVQKGGHVHYYLLTNDMQGGGGAGFAYHVGEAAIPEITYNLSIWYGFGDEFSEWDYTNSILDSGNMPFIRFHVTKQGKIIIESTDIPIEHIYYGSSDWVINTLYSD